jgi:hypothetical protein
MNKHLGTMIMAVAMTGLLLLAASPGTASAGQAQLAGMASTEQLQALRTQAAWIDSIAERMERRGRAISDTDLREIRQINNELVRLERVAQTAAGSARTGVLNEDAENLADRISHVWLRLREGTLATPGTTQAPAPAPMPVTATTIPNGTRVIVKTTSWLSSKSAAVGDRFSTTLVDPIYVDGRVAIPAGAMLEGTVTEVDSAGRASDAGKLHLMIDRLRSGDGQSADVRGMVVGTGAGKDLDGKGADVGITAGGAAAGAIAGALLGGGKGALIGLAVGGGGALLAQKGKDVDLPEGTVLRVEFQNPVNVTWTWKPVGNSN